MIHTSINPVEFFDIVDENELELTMAASKEFGVCDNEKCESIESLGVDVITISIKGNDDTEARKFYSCRWCLAQVLEQVAEWVSDDLDY